MHHILTVPKRLDLIFSTTPYDRMHKAIDYLGADPGPLNSYESEVGHAPPLTRGTHLRSTIVESFHSQSGQQGVWDAQIRDGERQADVQSSSGLFRDDSRIQSWITRHSQHPPISVDGDPDMGWANPTQVRAVSLMLNNKLSLVKGVIPSPLTRST